MQAVTIIGLYKHISIDDIGPEWNPLYIKLNSTSFITWFLESFYIDGKRLSKSNVHMSLLLYATATFKNKSLFTKFSILDILMLTI